MFVDDDVDDETIGAIMVVKRVVTCRGETIQGMIGVLFLPGPPFQERESHSISPRTTTS